MQHLGAPLPVEIEGFQAAIGEDLVVAPLHPAIRRRRPHMCRQGLGERPETVLVFAGRLLRPAKLRDVLALHENAIDHSVLIADRLIDEIEKALFRLGAFGGLENDARAIGAIRRTRPVDLVEPFVNTLPGDIRQSLAHRLSDQVLTADDRPVGTVDD